MTPEESREYRNALMRVAELRDYLREKNEIIKAYAGPRNMTPEDVAFALAERDHLTKRLAEVGKWFREAQPS